MKWAYRVMFLANLLLGVFNFITKDYILAIINVLWMITIVLWWIKNYRPATESGRGDVAPKGR